MNNKSYTADDVYRVMKQDIRNILWNDLWLSLYGFNEEYIWLYDEADEVQTTYDELAQALNNGDTVEFYRLERVKV